MKGRLVLFTPGHTEPGGAARRSQLLADGLCRSGWELRVITRAGTLRRPRVGAQPGLKVLEVPGFGRRRLGAVLFLLGAIPLGLVWGRRASALVSLQLMSTTTAASLCSLLLRRPYLALATTSGSLGEVRYLSSTKFAPLRLGLLRRAEFLVAQTHAVAEELATVVPADRVAVLPNPVVIPTAVPPLRGVCRALYAGRLSEEKDVPCLLEAWKALLRERPAAELIIAGSGGAFRSVEPLVRRMVTSDPALRKSVKMTGWVSSLEPYLRETDVFILPSREEGMSNALLEACAWGRVVVASDIAPNRAIVGNDYPLLFPPGDADALADKLRRALDPDEPLRVEVRATVLERVQSFSVEAVVARLEAMIHAADRARN